MKNKIISSQKVCVLFLKLTFSTCIISRVLELYTEFSPAVV